MAAGIDTAQIVSAFNSLQQTLLTFVVPSAGLAAVYGGLIHAHVFHTEQAVRQGRDILKYAVVAILIAGLGPALLKSLAGLVGVPA
ncbi:MAG: hypothetical protein C7B44_04670 [Sulfobacillus thermosulfidooxidans]|uniref:Uncharacterized protein n=2 Tax=Sulfobacillus thermosulfidooxidans TaxID=28034 RepID=A0A1W1WPD8_SULTA|nr:hypothetical protein [Sulfobacillus thermosulfidooxidans]PSR20379.1 MAG: hypothetical protein C7B47_18065 [Sulfobacillus thermosulfidooxidans]PSR37262.1 MAG: hypothetical protein C7B44_04670 [Sulfobacillus thermosulfidooxidans]SMC08184.1 hypothetical protein SAMN00768000_3723 [Sulfobacillus thermosulfidooxidans DSM 9293]